MLKQHPIHGFYFILIGFNWRLFIMDDFGNAVQLRRNGTVDWNKLYYTLRP